MKWYNTYEVCEVDGDGVVEDEGVVDVVASELVPSSGAAWGAPARSSVGGSEAGSVDLVSAEDIASPGARSSAADGASA